MKTQSDRLRKTATDFGGGRGTNNKKARLLEKNLYTTVRDKLLPQLEKDFPNCVFVLQRDLKKTDIARNLGRLNWKPESDDPYIKGIYWNSW